MMTKIEIDKNDLKTINETFARLDDFAKNDALAYLQDVVFENAYDLADRHTKDGNLLQSLYHKKINSNTYELGADANKASYAIFVHNGTRAHDIMPKTRKFLRWVKSDRFVFAKKVRHPGYRGDPFFIKAVHISVPQFKAWADKQKF